jgi:hypothetical protein
MPLPTPSKEQLANKEGEKSFLAECMGNSNMLKEFPDAAQRYAVCLHNYNKVKSKLSQGILSVKANKDGVTNAIVKIKTNCVKESENYQEKPEIIADFLKNNGFKKLSKWFLSVDPNKEGQESLRYCITSDFENVDIAALENAMEVAASVEDTLSANQASDLLALALKKQNGETLSSYNFFVTDKGVTVEASF